MLARRRRKEELNMEGLSDSDYEDDESIAIEKCRVCLESGNIPIFGREDISEDVNAFGGINVSEVDNLPKKLCFDCHKQLEAAVAFRKKAQESELILMEQDQENDEFLRPKSPFSSCDDEKLNDADEPCEYLEYKESSSEEWKDDCESQYSLFKLPHYTTDTDSGREESKIELEIKDTDDECEKEKENDTYMVIVSDEQNDKNIKIKIFACEVCDLTFKTTGELDEHSLSQHDSKTSTKCEICGNIVSKLFYKVHVQLHRETYKRKAAKRYKKIECKVCGKLIGKSYMKYHMTMHGTEEQKAERVRECQICKKLFSANYYAEHMKHVHMQAEKKGKQKDDKKETPIVKRHKQKSIQCPICDRPFKEHKFKAHLACHGRPPKKYICDKCGREFIYASAFKTHTLTHGGELKFKCQFCPYRGLHQGLLKVHVRTHTKDYPYECTECSARFLTKSNLTMHQRRHGNPHIKCPECDKAFYMKRNLDKHYNLIHLGIRDYKCDICGKAFGHRDSMLCHQKKVHKRENLTDRVGRIPSYLQAEHTKKEDEDDL